MSSRTDAWLPLYIADYRADTTRFSTEQHGAYLLIIMDYWRNGAPPDDDAVLSQITGLPPVKWKKHRATLAAKFQIDRGVWKHKRIEAELTKAKGKQAALSERGKQGAEARWGKDATGIAHTECDTHGSGMQQALPDDVLADAPSPSHTQEVLPSPQPPAPTPSPSNPVATGVENPTPAPSKVVGRTIAVWRGYSDAYRERYTVDPVRNKTVNAKLASFIERISTDEAPAVAAFYVRSNRQLYVAAKHPVDLLLRDAEGLRTEWATGRSVTDTEARQADRTQANGNVFGKLINEAERRETNGRTE